MNLNGVQPSQNFRGTMTHMTFINLGAIIVDFLDSIHDHNDKACTESA